MRGTARPVPPATSALPGRLRLVSHARPGQHRACPPSLRWGHVCGAAWLPNPCPALADGQSWAHLGLRPALLGDQGTMVRVSVLGGTASLSLPHISLPRASFKRWKIPAGGRHGRERGGWAGELCRQCQQICRMGGPLHQATWPAGCVSPWAGLAPALCPFPRSGPGPAQSPGAHTVPVGAQHTWGQAASPASPACATQHQPECPHSPQHPPVSTHGSHLCPARAQGVPGSRWVLPRPGTPTGHRVPPHLLSL